MALWLKGQRSKLGSGSGLDTAIRRGFELYECHIAKTVCKTSNGRKRFSLAEKMITDVFLRSSADLILTMSISYSLKIVEYLHEYYS